MRILLCMFVLCRQTRKFMQRWIKPGVKLIDMCELLEDTARNMVEANGLKSGRKVSRVRFYHKINKQRTLLYLK